MVSRTPGPLLVLVGVLALSGCGGTDKTPETASTTSPTSTPTTATSPPRPTTPASTTPSSPTTSSRAPTCLSQKADLTDGTWAGPLRMNVQGTGGTTEFTDSVGRGNLRMVVVDGSVSSGSWSVRWTSKGHVDTGNASADLNLVGTIGGKISGTVPRPTLTGSWHLVGAATITRPVHQSAPIDETGPDTATLTLGKVSVCVSAPGSFTVSFTSKDAQATFTGGATWRGSRLDTVVEATS